MLSNEIKRLKMKKIKFENVEKNHEIRHRQITQLHMENENVCFHVTLVGSVQIKLRFCSLKLIKKSLSCKTSQPYLQF